jgi:hypothetical protein
VRGRARRLPVNSSAAMQAARRRRQRQRSTCPRMQAPKSQRMKSTRFVVRKWRTKSRCRATRDMWHRVDGLVIFTQAFSVRAQARATEGCSTGHPLSVLSRLPPPHTPESASCSSSCSSAPVPWLSGAHAARASHRPAPARLRLRLTLRSKVLEKAAGRQVSIFYERLGAGHQWIRSSLAPHSKSRTSDKQQRQEGSCASCLGARASGGGGGG